MNTTSEINPRWQSFAANLLAGLKATEAYLQAGYQPKSRSSAQVAASRLRKHPAFAAYYESMRREPDTQSRKQTVTAILRRLNHLALVIATSAAGEKAARTRHGGPVFTRRRTLRNGTRITHMPCKLKAIRQYALLAGYLDVISENNPLET